MRFTQFMTGIFCLANTAFAQPPLNSPNDACCCCDAGRNVISCTRSIAKADCFCAAVVCPANAATVFDDKLPSPTSTTAASPTVAPTSTPTALGNGIITNADEACCCCNVNQGAISCSRSIRKDECVCAAVQCPNNAPFVWEDGQPISGTPRPRPRQSQGNREFATVVKGAGSTSSPASRKYPCCCCDIGAKKIVCRARAQQDCYCPAVQCPKGAETLFL